MYTIADKATYHSPSVANLNDAVKNGGLRTRFMLESIAKKVVDEVTAVPPYDQYFSSLGLQLVYGGVVVQFPWRRNHEQPVSLPHDVQVLADRTLPSLLIDTVLDRLSSEYRNYDIERGRVLRT